MERFVEIHGQINALVWGAPLIIALMGAGLFLTLWTGGIQFRRFGYAFREVLGKLFEKGSGTGTVTPFQAVATALASTVGVGNIAGVATAIHLGGPGALFWLLVSGLFGMCTKFSEIAVALHYREEHEGTMRGGAMYVLKNGLELAVARSDLRALDEPCRVRHRQHGPGELRRRRGSTRASESGSAITGLDPRSWWSRLVVLGWHSNASWK